MSKRTVWVKLICITMVLSIFLTHAYALQISPLSDSEFDIVTTNLKSTKKVTFSCTTYDIKNSIRVTACWLEKKATNGSWFYVCNLTPPTTVITDTFAYYATVDYSSYIGTGTYRIWATYNADGHTVTRCSNERTY